MANTVIQLKYSTQTATPSSLNVAEPAYSYTSNIAYIGSPAGTGSIAIGGKFYIDQQGLIYNHANAAFLAANNASDIWVRNQANGAFIAANSAGTYANAAFDLANTFASVNVTQNNNITAAFTKANGAFDKANSAYTNAGTAQTTADNAATAASNAQTAADNAQNSATAAYAQANTATNTATAAYTRANNSINANTGGIITADLVITGNLTVQGNTTRVDTITVATQDSLIRLANNNTVADTVDIGFYGAYNSGGVKYTGLVRQAGADYFLFKNLTSDPTSNVLAAGSLTLANTGTLTANLNTSVITNQAGTDLKIGPAGKETTIVSSTGVILPYGAFVGGNYSGNRIDVSSVGFGTQIKGLYEGVDISVSTDGSGANVSQFKPDGTVTLFGPVTAAGVNLNSLVNTAYAQANTAVATNLTQNTSIAAAFTAANSAADSAAAAFAAANTSTGVNLTQNTSIAAVFSLANGTALIANTDYTNISIGSADYGSASSVAAFKVAANGRIISANTTTIAIDASAISTGTLSVGRGGTGATSFTTNGVLLGAGGSALTTASSSTEGHVLTINNSGVPTFSHLQGGTF
jgi:hypothetical protein